MAALWKLMRRARPHACLPGLVLLFALNVQVASAQTDAPMFDRELARLDGITDVVVEDRATDGCWPEPKTTRQRIVARLEAAKLFKGKPRPPSPQAPEAGDREYDLKLLDYRADMSVLENWERKKLILYVHGFDTGLQANGEPVPFCIAFAMVLLNDGLMRPHHLFAFLRTETPNVVEEALLSLTDRFIAAWNESNK